MNTDPSGEMGKRALEFVRSIYPDKIGNFAIPPALFPEYQALGGDTFSAYVLAMAYMAGFMEAAKECEKAEK